MSATPHVVIIGAGFGGLQAARDLAHANVRITLIDKANHHLFQPLLYQVAVAALSAPNIAWPVRSIIAGQQNLRFILDEAVSVDRDAQMLGLKSGEHLSYDYLIVAPGAGPSYFGHNDWADYAPGLKTMADALYIRERMLLAYEKASRLPTPERRAPWLTFVLVGAGPTGVEMAGSIAEIGRKNMVADYDLVGPDEIRVILVEAGPRVLPSYSPDLSAHALQDLKDLGVEVLLNARVTGVGEDHVIVGEQRIPTHNIVWAAGNAASPLIAQLHTETDNAGRAIVLPDCSLPGDPNVFVIGDAAHFATAQGRALPGVVQVARQQAKFVARIIAQRIPAAWRPAFSYLDLGSMATIGRARAIVEMGKFKATGLIAWLMWCFLHVVMLINLRNRIIVFIEWMWFYIKFRPGSQLIFWQDVANYLPERIRLKFSGGQYKREL